MWWKSLLTVSILLALIAGAILVWEKRSDKTSPAASASQLNSLVMSHIYPGGSPPVTLPGPEENSHEELSAFDVSEGKRLYHWMNCHTCHANGGGDIGPPLMDGKWLYGSAPRNIFASIVEGRPNGMPSFRGKIPDAQVWQLVSYIRSMSANVPLTARPSRDDDLQAKPPESMAPNETPVHGGSPPPDSRSTTP